MRKSHILLSLMLVGCLFLMTGMLLVGCTDEPKGPETPADSGTSSATEADTTASAETAPESLTDPAVDSDSAAESVVATDSGTETEFDRDPETTVLPSTDTETVTESEIEPSTETETETETMTEIKTETEIETEIETEEETYEVRLYSLMPENSSLMQSFVIRTKHGKLIVLDGGIDGTGLDAKAYMPAALRAIAGVGQKGYVEVEAWILSNAHKDHFNELRKTLEEYKDDENFVIKQFIFDFPEFESEEYPASNADSGYLEFLKNAMNAYAEARGLPVTEDSTYYDDVNGAFANAATIAEGCELEIDGVRLEFLQTWRKEDGANINNTSLIFRAWVEGQSILFLQDTAVERGLTLVNTYGEAIKSDIVQMAHHGQGGVSKVAYDRINAAVRIWPTPLWVWNNPATYAIEDTRMWVNGGVDFTEDSEWDIVTCLYDKYPSARIRVSEWEKVLAYQSIALPYEGVNTAPPPPETEPEETIPDEPPIEHDYVSEGLVSMYQGGEGKTWIDVIGPHNVKLTVNDRNYLSDEGLYLDSVRQFFPQAIVDLINGDEFTVEMAMKDFTPLGSTYNTFMNSSDDAFALFRQCDGSNDFLMMKWAGKPATVRPKTENGMLALLSGKSTLTLTFKVGGSVTIYINGEMAATYEGVDSMMGAGDLYIGHDQSSRNFKALFTSVRFYNVALTAEQVAANAAVDKSHNATA